MTDHIFYIITIFTSGIANTAAEKIFRKLFEKTCNKLDLLLDAPTGNLNTQVPVLFRQLMLVELNEFSKPRIIDLLNTFVERLFFFSNLQAERIPCGKQEMFEEVCKNCVNSDKVQTFQDIVYNIFKHIEWGQLFLSAVEKKISNILENWDEYGNVLKNFTSLSVVLQKKTTLFFFAKHVSICSLLNMVCELLVNHFKDEEALVNTVASILTRTQTYMNVVNDVFLEAQNTRKFFEVHNTPFEAVETPEEIIFKVLTEYDKSKRKHPLVKKVLERAYIIYQEKTGGKEEAED